MTCQECELLLADGGETAAVEKHLQECPECRSLALELDANALALSSLKLDQLPPVRPLQRPASFPQRPASFPWMSGAAAAAILVLLLNQALQWQPSVTPPPRPRVITEPVTVTAQADPPPVRRKKPRLAPASKEETLLVKMLTPDPDVVIYWLVDPKEGPE